MKAAVCVVLAAAVFAGLAVRGDLSLPAHAGAPTPILVRGDAAVATPEATRARERRSARSAVPRRVERASLSAFARSRGSGRRP